ncbi:hypothetical protein KUV85_16575 [Nocardioides panacisoli]|uniref:hypothetical protein n=1 Tax=Nocardioides panacisoli TaxID=627624 RepID=UPI001C63132B|nr:hypothetical protein [Nocardioides panacisoli]QYJ03915.1 hypothetical protein KUV85_16575 [Nocardioides panacisoli]
MATQPLSGPPDDSETAALRAERDALARRAAAAERRIAELETELARARGELAQQADREQDDGLSLFEGGESTGSPIAGDGSDPRALPLILGATAIVAAMVTLLAFLNGNLFTWFGIGMAAITAGLAYAAVATRVEPVSVHLARGIVHIEQGDTKYRFDLSHEATRVEQHGRPGDSDWRITFARRHTGPFSVDATMVDAAAFSAQVQQYRPSL